ncbi:hypothetical protein [Rivularia sp. PCC 7116]|uniref:hypothetical protein n=1 Tax=Rivularia sp. PCC 7116 TaxID=373994 RepID=UPI000303E0CD|nr:hypothetical protein [Rivularia sp. PCC 7116]
MNKTTSNENWKVGDTVIHELLKQFGVVEIINVFGSGNKVSLAIKCPDLALKIIDPATGYLQKIE